MKTAGILNNLALELKESAKHPENIRDYSRFYKDGKTRLGLASPVVKRIASKYFKEAEKLGKEKILTLANQLLKINQSDCREIAFGWAFRTRRHYQKEDFKTFEFWLKKYVDDWAGCDDLCTHAFGAFIYQFPEFLPKIKKWTGSSNQWLRRASAVVLIYSLRKGKYLNEAFNAAKTLMKDNEDLVQKGCGWMLKETSNLYPNEVFNFVIKHRRIMPRVILRYAVEKFPHNMRKEAMKK